MNSSEGWACRLPIRSQFVLPLTVAPNPGTRGRASSNRPAPASGHASRSQTRTGVRAARAIIVNPTTAKIPCRAKTEKEEPLEPSYEVIDVAESTMSRPRLTRHRQATTSIVVPGSRRDGLLNIPRSTRIFADGSECAEARLPSRPTMNPH